MRNRPEFQTYVLTWKPIPIDKATRVLSGRGSKGTAIRVERITRSGWRLLVDVHPEELDVEAMKMRNVRNEIHKVGQLAMSVDTHLIKTSTYPNPKHMLHVEVLWACFKILASDVPIRAKEIIAVGANEHPTGDTPEIHALSRRGLALLPAGI